MFSWCITPTAARSTPAATTPSATDRRARARLGQISRRCL
jgi:hypothetical protein